MSIRDQLFQKGKRGFQYHAYLITGDVSGNLEELKEEVEEVIGGGFDGNADCYLKFSPVFSIADSRELVGRQKTRAFSGRRFFIVASYTFTPEAQNGLLKVLEDSAGNNHFFVLAPSEDQLLPTLRSRLFHVQGMEDICDDVSGWCEEFIGADIPERFLMIEKLLKGGDGGDDSKTQKRKVLDILNQLEKTYAGEMEASHVSFLVELISLKKYMNDAAPASRLILEYVAFTCPQAK